VIQVSRKGLFGVPYVIINNSMPTYVVKNKKTEEEKEIFCSYEKRNEWLKENPDWIGVIGSPSTISQHGSTLGRTSSDWQNLLSSIKKGSGGNNETAVKHGFSKKNKLEKIDWIIKTHFHNIFNIDVMLRKN